MILNDAQISDLAADGMIDPFFGDSIKGPGGTSYGVSSFGYDVRVGREWKTYRPAANSLQVIDPAAITEDDVIRHEADEFVLQAGGFVLAHTIETLSLPRDVVGMVKDKSTLARAGVTLQTTVLEPGWSGQITLEIFNNSPNAVLLRAGQGIAQILFFRGAPCRVSYADRGGKYQGQTGVTLPRAGRAA